MSVIVHPLMLTGKMHTQIVGTVIEVHVDNVAF